MLIIDPSVEIVYPSSFEEWEKEFKLIEVQGRTCYKSEDKITDSSYKKFVRNLQRRKHFQMMEFGDLIFKFITNRGVLQEITRHRLASFQVESTRYCNYSMEKFGNQITVIKPAMFDTWNVLTQVVWETAMINAETSYFELLNKGLTPQEARGVLPHDLKTEITVKMNFRELDHFFDLRYRGITGAPHPDMKQVAELLYNEITEKTPFRGFEEDD